MGILNYLPFYGFGALMQRKLNICFLESLGFVPPLFFRTPNDLFIVLVPTSVSKEKRVTGCRQGTGLFLYFFKYFQWLKLLQEEEDINMIFLIYVYWKCLPIWEVPFYLLQVSFKSLNKSGDCTLFIERSLSLISISSGDEMLFSGCSLWNCQNQGTFLSFTLLCY